MNQSPKRKHHVMILYKHPSHHHPRTPPTTTTTTVTITMWDHGDNAQPFVFQLGPWSWNWIVDGVNKTHSCQISGSKNRNPICHFFLFELSHAESRTRHQEPTMHVCEVLRLASEGEILVRSRWSNLFALFLKHFLEAEFPINTSPNKRWLYNLIIWREKRKIDKKSWEGIVGWVLTFCITLLKDAVQHTIRERLIVWISR